MKNLNKHAYLIMAYNNFDFLKKLLSLLDDERNDIFIHIDERAVDFEESAFKNCTKYSKLIFIPRHVVYWADYSQTNVQLELLKYACENDTYKYYHLISGSDLPLKTQNQIHDFLDDKNYEFVGICPDEVWYCLRRVKFYHPLVHNKHFRNSKFLKGMDRLFEYVQKLVGVNRLKNKDIKIVDGWNWFSITDDFARYLLDKRSFIEKTFRKTIASDEMIVQTMLINSDFYNRIYNKEDLVKGSLRYIDWSDEVERPRVFREKDFDNLINCEEAIFARKFDPEKDSVIIEKLYNYIINA